MSVLLTLVFNRTIFDGTKESPKQPLEFVPRDLIRAADRLAERRAAQRQVLPITVADLKALLEGNVPHGF